jgi:3-oxoacyl-[acyl-carrier-protein] synthase-3
MPISSIISGVGSYFPDNVVPNSDFLDNTFYRPSGEKIQKDSQAIVDKLASISGIQQRYYIEDQHDSAEMAAQAGLRAVEDAGLNKEDLDGIIVAHNAGNLTNDTSYTYTIPNLASVVKKRMSIMNPFCSALDIIFGCPGWVEAAILAHQRIAVGDAKHILVIGVEVLSRKIDPHDMDSMLFGDAAGATVISAHEGDDQRGIINYKTFSHCENGEVEYINMGGSYSDDCETDGLFIKMQGRKVYKYAVTKVPELISLCLKKANLPLADVKKFLLHQANEKMIIAMAEKLFAEHNLDGNLHDLVPMNLQQTGNTSVATIPTLLDQIRRGEKGEHSIKEGDLIVFASVGAGMHANCLLYRA